MIDEGLKRWFLGRDDVKRLLPKMEEAVASATLTPTESCVSTSIKTSGR